MSSFLDHFSFNPNYAGCLASEEEVWTVDPKKNSLIVVAPRLFKSYPEGWLKPELPAQQLEMVTPICRSVDELYLSLDSNRKKLDILGRMYGFRANYEPTPWQNFPLEVYPKERYQHIKETVPEDTLRHGWIIGQHVHIGCGNIREAIFLLNLLREYMPILLAVSARSKQYLGEKRGYVCERFLSYMQMCPNFVPPCIENVEHFISLAKEQNFYENPKDCWWGVRINPVGTVEVRLFDVQKSASHAVQLAMLVKVIASLGFKENRGIPRSSACLLEELYAVAKGKIRLCEYEDVFFDLYNLCEKNLQFSSCMIWFEKMRKRKF